MNNNDLIILIDDDQDILNILNSAFKLKEFDTISFKNGKEALSFLNDKNKMKKAKLIILDRILPDMDGIDILKKYPTHIPVLILSVLNKEEDILDGLSLGAVDYITKPFNLPNLIEKALLLLENKWK